MSEQLSALVSLLGRLSFEELDDLVFRVSYALADAQSHSSKKDDRIRAESELRRLRSGRKGKRYVKLSERSADMQSAIHLVEQLPPDDQRTAVTVAQALHQTLKPIERRRKRRTPAGNIEEVGSGRVEVKYIRVPVYDIFTGERATDDDGNKLSRGPDGVGPNIRNEQGHLPPGYGPYIYVRVWATGGGRERDQKQLKSRYVGLKGLAMRFEALEAGSADRRALAEEILDRYERKTLRAWAQENYPDPDLEEGEIEPTEED